MGAIGLLANRLGLTTRQTVAPLTGPPSDSGGGSTMSIRGTANQVSVNGSFPGAASSGIVTLALPQSIATTSTPQFARLGLGQAADATAVLGATGGGFFTGDLVAGYSSVSLPLSATAGRALYAAASGANPRPGMTLLAAASSGTSEGGIFSRLAGGTLAVPTATPNNSAVSLFLGTYGGTTWDTNTASIRLACSEAHSESARGTFISFTTTLTGATAEAERMRISASGGQLLIGTTAVTNVVVGPGLKIVNAVLDSGGMIRGDRDVTLAADSAETPSSLNLSQTMALAGFTHSGTVRGSVVSVRVSGTGTQSSSMNANETSVGISGASATTLAAANCFYGTLITGSSGSSTITNGRGMVADQQANGGVITNVYGFFANSTLAGGTFTAGFYGIVSSGSGKWNCYMSGTADNHFAGNVLVGGTSTTGLTGSGGLRVFSTTEATTSAGSGIFDGGVLVKKALFVNSATDTSSGTTGSIVTAGGVGVAKKINQADTTEASNTGPAGAFITAGGIYAAKKIISATEFDVGANKVVGARDTGWTAWSGSATNKATAYDTATITLPQLAERTRAIQEALTTHGLLGT